MKKRLAFIMLVSFSLGLSACGERADEGDTSTETMEAGGLYPSPVTTPTVVPPPTDPAVTQAVNEAENLAPTPGQLPTASPVPTPPPLSRTGTDVAELRGREVPDGGSPMTIGSFALIAAIGLAVIIAAIYARRRGHLQSRAAQVAVVVVVAVLAALAWLGPALFTID